MTKTNNVTLNISLIIGRKDFAKQRHYLHNALSKTENHEDYNTVLGLQNLCDYIADQIYYQDKVSYDKKRN